MSTEEKQGSDELQSTQERRDIEPETDEHHQVVDAPDPPEPTEKPEVTDEHREKAKEMAKDNNDDRPTICDAGHRRRSIGHRGQRLGRRRRQSEVQR